MHLIQLLLPLRANDGSPYPRDVFDRVRSDLTERFGGVTAYLRAPAVGAWKEDETSVSHDDVVTIEVMTDELDRPWWSDWRTRLEQAMGQKEIVIRASVIERL